MAYKYNDGTKPGTKLISVRIRRDILDKMEMLGCNKSKCINILLERWMKAVDHGEETIY